MASPSASSNFNSFQEVLRQSRAPMSMPTVSETTSGPSSESEGHSGDDATSARHWYSRPKYHDGSVDQEEPPRAFLRRTQIWRREPGGTGPTPRLRLEERLEEPDEAWEQWTTVRPGSSAARVYAHIMHTRVFDVTGRKTTDELNFLPWSKFRSDFSFLDTLYSLSTPNSGQHFIQYDTVTEDKYKWLFFAKGSILLHLETGGSHSTLFGNPLAALVRFIDETFREASHAQEQMRQSGLASYEHLWTLYPPQELIYERRLVPPCNTPYEQCWRIRAVEEFTSFTDQGRALRLIVEDVIYARGPRPGPCLIMSCRYIRPYTGSKPITADGLGIVPLGMLPEQEQDAIRARLVEMGRRYMDICAMPFSVMDYDGPFSLCHPRAINNTKEEMILSSTERAVQKYTAEKVVVDTTAFRRSQLSYDIGIDHILDGDPRTPYSAVHIPLSTEGILTQPNETLNEELYLICRGQVPAYLISSGVQAIGIIVSLLRPPSWKAISPSLSSVAGVDLGLWTTLIGDFLTEGGDRDAKHQRRRARGSGLVLLLQGTKGTTHAIPRCIAEDLHKPLVTWAPDESLTTYDYKEKDALRWGGMLLIEQREDLMTKEALEDLPSAFTFYPGVVFLAVSSATTLSERYLDTVDAVINCENTLPLSSSTDEPPQAALWHQYLADELPSILENLAEEKVRQLCRLLAEFEPREGRMPKVLLTAERLAQSRGCRVGVEHVLTVVGQAVAPGDVAGFEAGVAAGGFRLGC